MDEFSQPFEEHLEDDMLNEYLDGYLSPEDASGVERHLSACQTCAEKAHQLQTLFADLQELPDVPLSHDLSRDILNSINTRPQIPWFVKWSMLPQIAFALIILVTTVPKQVRNWLAILPVVQHMPSEIDFMRWANQTLNTIKGLSNPFSSWQFSVPDLDISFPSFHDFNWSVFAIVLVFLFLINGYLLRQIAHNDSH